jgi:hypothetical protein
MKHFSILIATLFSVSAFAQIEVSEINYNSDSTFNSGNWIEIHNIGNTSVNLTGWLMTDANPSHIFNFPINKTLAPGAYLVVCDDTVKFKDKFPGVTNFIGEMSFGLSNNSDTITIYNNLGTVVYNMAYWDSSPWQKTADGMGRTLELRSSGLSPTLPSSWFAGCVGGSPGTAYSPCNDPIVVSEINYNSILQFNPGDWIELHNTTNSAIDLSLWRLNDSEDTNIYIFPAGTTIPANGYLVVLQDSVLFKQRFPNVTNYVAQMDFNLSNSGDRIRLYNAQTGRMQYSLAFNDKAPWPIGADGQGYTLELINENGIMNDADNWRIGCFGGSPGRAYDPGCGTGIEAISVPGFEFSVLENPVQGNLQLSIEGLKTNNSQLSIFDATGRKIFVTNNIENGKSSIQNMDLTSGLYIAVLADNTGKIARKFVVQ